MEKLKNYWSGLSDRERRLLMIAALLAAAVLAWLLTRPIMTMAEQVRQDHRQAVERHGRVMAKLEWLSRAAAQPSADLRGAGLLSFLTELAGERGLSLSRQEARGGQGASFTIAAGKAAVVMAWLAELERHGVAFDQLSITPQADGTVSVAADVRQVAAR